MLYLMDAKFGLVFQQPHAVAFYPVVLAALEVGVLFVPSPIFLPRSA